MTCEIHINDIGTIFEVTIVDCQVPPVFVDVSSATVLKEIHFRRPDNTAFSRDAVFKTDGTDGIIQYTTILDDLDFEGPWNIQGKVMLTGGTWHSELGSFDVIANLIDDLTPAP